MYNHETMQIDGVDVIVGKRIDLLRNFMGITQLELSKKLGVSQAAVCAWEIGKSIPRPGRINEITSALGVTKGQFIGNEPIVWQTYC